MSEEIPAIGVHFNMPVPGGHIQVTPDQAVVIRDFLDTTLKQYLASKAPARKATPKRKPKTP